MERITMSVLDSGATRTVVLGVAESDAHAVANKLIDLRLRELGFSVINLGVCTPLADFADAVTEHPQAIAVLIGSVNGHAPTDLRDLPALRAHGRLNRPVIVGGNLTIDPADRPAAKRLLEEFGVDHVLDDVDELEPLLASL